MASFTITTIPNKTAPLEIKYEFKVRGSFDSSISFTAGLRANYSEVFRATLSRPECVNPLGGVADPVTDWHRLLNEIVGTEVKCWSQSRNGEVRQFNAFVTDDTFINGDALELACYVLDQYVQDYVVGVK